MSVHASYLWILAYKKIKFHVTTPLPWEPRRFLPIQMATGYATFANGGYRIQPHFITRIEDAYGKVIYQANPEYACISCINTKEETTPPADTMTADDEAIASQQYKT